MANIETIRVKDLITSLAEQIDKTIEAHQIKDVLLLGIKSGGAWVAREIKKQLKNATEIGELNIAFYRDDFSRIGLHPTVEPSKMPLSIDDKHVILIDDIIYTGRTVRAAMNEVFDYGRPELVTFIALLDRGGRELPIQPNITGVKVELESNYNVKLTGPSNLKFKLYSK